MQRKKRKTLSRGGHAKFNKSGEGGGALNSANEDEENKGKKGGEKGPRNGEAGICLLRRQFWSASCLALSLSFVQAHSNKPGHPEAPRSTKLERCMPCLGRRRRRKRRWLGGVEHRKRRRRCQRRGLPLVAPHGDKTQGARAGRGDERSDDGESDRPSGRRRLCSRASDRWRRFKAPRLLLRPASPASLPRAALVVPSKKKGALAAGDARDVAEAVSGDLVGREAAEASSSEAGPRERRAGAAPRERSPAAAADAAAEPGHPVGAGARHGARVRPVAAVKVHVRLLAAAALEAPRPLVGAKIRRGGGGERGQEDERGERGEGEGALGAVGGHRGREREGGVGVGFLRKSSCDWKRCRTVRRKKRGRRKKTKKNLGRIDEEPTAPPHSFSLQLLGPLSPFPLPFRSRIAMVAHASVRSSLAARPVGGARRTAVAAKAQPAKATAAVSLSFCRWREPPQGGDLRPAFSRSAEPFACSPLLSDPNGWTREAA